MRRLPLLVLAGLAAATVAACGGNPPPAQPGPQANADSIAAAERARQDSIARAEADAGAREDAERVARPRAADSVAPAPEQCLVSPGIAAGRIATVSYGEGRPIAQGHDETAWAQNRRDEFEILSGGDALRQP